MVMVSTSDAVAAAAETFGVDTAAELAAFLVDGAPYSWDYTAEEISEGVNPSCSFA